MTKNSKFHCIKFIKSLILNCIKGYSLLRIGLKLLISLQKHYENKFYD